MYVMMWDLRQLWYPELYYVWCVYDMLLLSSPGMLLLLFMLGFYVTHWCKYPGHLPVQHSLFCRHCNIHMRNMEENKIHINKKIISFRNGTLECVKCEMGFPFKFRRNTKEFILMRGKNKKTYFRCGNCLFIHSGYDRRAENVSNSIASKESGDMNVYRE